VVCRERGGREKQRVGVGDNRVTVMQNNEPFLKFEKYNKMQ